MKIIETTGQDNDYGFERDISVKVEVITDNGEKLSVSFGEGEPEDMSLARDLSDVYSIASIIKLAYEAGKRGEELEIESLTENY